MQLFVWGKLWPMGKKAEGQEKNSVGSRAPWGSGRVFPGRRGEIWKGQHTLGVAVLWLHEILTPSSPGGR